MNRIPIRSKSSLFPCLYFTVFFFSALPFALAQQPEASEDSGQTPAVSQAQATLASLFGRGAKMPSIPRIDGTIALPSFDSSGMTIDEGALRAAEGRRPTTKAQGSEAEGRRL